MCGGRKQRELRLIGKNLKGKIEVRKKIMFMYKRVVVPAFTGFFFFLLQRFLVITECEYSTSPSHFFLQITTIHDDDEADIL